MNIVLCGNDGPAEQVLSWLITEKHNIAVYHNDPTGRLATMAQSLGIWNTATSINEALPPVFVPQIVASVYYRTIIQKHVINAVGGKVFNAHASLLPRHRGRSPVPWAIISGDNVTGVTFHYVDEGIDTGKILLQAAVQIDGLDTQDSLFDKLNQTVVNYFPAVLQMVFWGVEGQAQQGEPTYNKAGVPYDREINPDWTMAKIERFIRAMIYPPKKPATFNGADILSFEDYIDELQRRTSNAYKRSRVVSTALHRPS